MMTIRQYTKEDNDHVIRLLRLNTPTYFAAEEEDDLHRYLTNEVELYYVLEIDKNIVGCGGINFADHGTIGKISWDIFNPDYQGRSLGSQLLHYRIALLKSMDTVTKITVRTSQLAYRFYEKQGFVLRKVVKDYWSSGFDLYDMEYSEI